MYDLLYSTTTRSLEADSSGSMLGGSEVVEVMTGMASEHASRRRGVAEYQRIAACGVVGR